MFKMYFVKTANPYVFRRIDEIARTMLNANICRDATSITKKEAVYTKKTSKGNRYSRRKYPSWKEYIGFIPLTKDLVTIIKPIETMIKNAKAFDIDLQIVDKVPNIELDTNLEIDLTMSTSSIDDDDDEQYYHPYYKPSLQSDILVNTTWMCTKNPMYLRIKKALKPYGFTFDDPTDTSYPLMRLPRSKQLT